MKLFNRLSNGWQLGKMSLSIIRENPSLMLFPVISGFSLMVLAMSFFGGGFLLFGQQFPPAIGEEPNEYLVYALLFLFYFVNYFIVVFFNVGLVHCARTILNGEKTTVGEGLAFALTRIDTILSWAFMAATVGMLLRTMQERLGNFGKIVSGIAGTVWSIATFFVVPILAYEDVNPTQAVKRSTQLIKQHWGESIGANFSFGLFNFLGILLIALPSGFFLGYVVHPVAGVIIGFMLMMFTIIAVAAAETVFLAAIYQYVNNEPIGAFDSQILDDAFYQK